MTSRRHPLTLIERRLDNWPAEDRELWVKRTSSTDPFDEGAEILRGWSASTLRSAERSYGRWLSWLDRRGALLPGQSPSARVSVDLVRTYCRELSAQGQSDHSVAAYLCGLSQAIRLLEPNGDWRWIGRAAGRIRADAVPKSRAHQMQPVDALLGLSASLLDATEAADDRERFLQFRDGLIIGLLVRRPLRLKNLTEITLGQHLSERAGAWRLEFTADEMKGARDFALMWPADLQAPLEEYLRTFRYHAVARSECHDHRRLWVSYEGDALQPSTVAQRINERTQEAFPHHINPHLFRKIVATFLADDDPEAATDAARLLAHANMATTERHYIEARRVKAFERHQSGIRKLRAEASRADKEDH